MGVRKKIYDVNVVKWEEIKEETWEKIMKQLLNAGKLHIGRLN